MHFICSHCARIHGEDPYAADGRGVWLGGGRGCHHTGHIQGGRPQGILQGEWAACTCTHSITVFYPRVYFTGCVSTQGLSASYLGISETVIQFVVYEKLKRMAQNTAAAGANSTPAAQLAAAEWRNAAGDGEADLEVGAAAPAPAASSGSGSGSAQKDFSLWHAFGCGATAKLIASCLSYPHEVVRTRLREVHTDPAANTRGIVGWLREIAVKEGVRGLYGGLGVHLLRTVPNAAILFVVVEALAGDI